MAIVDENPRNSELQVMSQTSSSHPKDDPSATPSPLKKVLTPKEAITAVASRVAAQPLQCSDSDVWGVLTAISNNARERPQGINILLTADEHCIGRVVDDMRFQIESVAVSQRHCEIFRKKVPKEDAESPSGFCFSVFVKDSSTNGTFINWDKLKRGSSMFEARINHGDIVSLAAPPEHEKAFAFVYREVLSSDGTILKRKAEEFSNENKRLKGIGIGAPEGPVSLDDFRSLQRSNTGHSVTRKINSDGKVDTLQTLHNLNEDELGSFEEAWNGNYRRQLSLRRGRAKKKIEGAIEQTIQWLDWNHHLHDAHKFENKLKKLQNKVEEAKQCKVEDIEYSNLLKARIGVDKCLTYMSDTLRFCESNIKGEDKNKLEVAIEQTFQWLQLNYHVHDVHSFEEKLKELQGICDSVTVVI